MASPGDRLQTIMRLRDVSRVGEITYAAIAHRAHDERIRRRFTLAMADADKGNGPPPSMPDPIDP